MPGQHPERGRASHPWRCSAVDLRPQRRFWAAPRLDNAEGLPVQSTLEDGLAQLQVAAQYSTHPAKMS